MYGGEHENEFNAPKFENWYKWQIILSSVWFKNLSTLKPIVRYDWQKDCSIKDMIASTVMSLQLLLLPIPKQSRRLRIFIDFRDLFDCSIDWTGDRDTTGDIDIKIRAACPSDDEERGEKLADMVMLFCHRLEDFVFQHPLRTVQLSGLLGNDEPTEISAVLRKDREGEGQAHAEIPGNGH